ncbi:unnamed protein product [Chondrus crispus]|uniref:ATP-dependent RNA helicase n=1 Tax=Chondrus crispus TaxID=2769 RepID=R7Q9J4_CHOCR|nr:unnamed protein product [Chondrus crispus]CDF34729.1 unnamed protein product [Chondrus crispus]|eukprot:XP_005714548.1 unnamed protein product [Chondrus crispus]
MELNLASTSSSKPHLRGPSNNKGKAKGSWRKRRREQVIQRVHAQKRQRPSNRSQPKSTAFRLQADEFSSGIDKENLANAVGSATPAKAKAANAPGKVRPSSSDSVAKLPNLITVGGSDADEKQKKERELPKKSKVHFKDTAPVADKPDQRPETVNATLDILGRDPIRISEGKESQTSGTAPTDPSGATKTSKEDDMFGISSFEETGLYPSVARHLTNRMQLEFPTLIQEKVLKAMLNLGNGQNSIDVLVRSATGSGKTLAYLLPIAHYLLNRSRRVTREKGSLGVIIVPTRELADQVEEVAERVFRPWHWIVVGCVRGGESKHREKARLRKGVNVLVATPGRLLDHMRNTRSFTYEHCEFLVLDEADRLLDLGFEAAIKEVIENLDTQAKRVNPEVGPVRSNILLSATLRNDVEKLAEFSLKSPVEISVGQGHDTKSSFAMPMQLRQHFCIVEQRHRLVTLASLLRLRSLKGMSKDSLKNEEHDGPPCKIIVFFSTCDSVDFHYDLLRKASLPKELQKDQAVDLKEKLLPLKVLRIHGNHTQSDRVEALRTFRRSERAVLFCTDVAARGLDLKGLTFAIQYDPPTGGQGEELEYLHRAGRTARIGAQGDALLFLLPSERAYIGKLETKGVSISEVSGSAAMAALYPKVILSRQESISYGTRLVTSVLQESFENIVKEDGELKGQAVSGFQAYCRAYATHARDVRYFFHVRNLHLGHVARAFVLGDKPAELSQMMSELKAARTTIEADQQGSVKKSETKKKGDIARAIAEGEKQPYNDQQSALARRRRERGRGQESFKELAMEFGA